MERKTRQGIGDAWTLVTIVATTAITVFTRSLFFLSEQPWRLPAWRESGLQYAPIAALDAVVVPEIAMSQGHLLDSWKDARLFATAGPVVWFFWQRGLLGSIIVGMAIYLPLHVGLGW